MAAPNVAPAPPATVAEAEILITRLQVRLAGLARRLASAADAGDVDRLLELRTEAEELPVRLQMAQVQHLTLKIADCETRRPAARAELEAAAWPALEAARTALAAAQAAFQQAANVVSALQTEEALARQDAGALRRQRAELLQLTPHFDAPVVRSVPHTPRRAEAG